MKKVLFVIHKRIDSYGIPIGLVNSAKFIVNALISLGIDAKLVSVDDNNGIDREVSLYKPTHVVIEALWVIPDKFDVLLPLHPKIQWLVRIHSKTPFLSMEGVAIDWIKKYDQKAKKYGNLAIAVNSLSLQSDLRDAMGICTVYLPNIYSPTPSSSPKKDRHSHTLDVGCFGAIRPLKNNLIQALAAETFAKAIKRHLRFHINSNRIEQKGDTILNNLRSLVGPNFELVEHPWLPHSEFLDLVKKMDIGLQVSLSESFNIVTADFVSNDIPIVVSQDISWMPWITRADPNSMSNIVDRMRLLWFGIGMSGSSKRSLDRYNALSMDLWSYYIRHSNAISR